MTPRVVTKVKAIKPVRYRGRSLIAGELFDVDTRDLITLRMLGKVEQIGEAIEPGSRYGRRDMRAVK